MSLGHSPSIVTSGLVLCLDAGNIKSYLGSGATWTDLSGNGNNVTLTNGPTYDSANGGGLVFNGTNQYGSINAPLAGNTSFTLIFWFKSSSISTEQGLYDSGYATPSNVNPQGFLIEIYQSKLSYQVGNTFLQSTRTLLNNTTYCAAIVKTYGSSGTFYINGVSAGSTISVDANMTGASAKIGTFLTPSSYFVGRLYTTQVYNRALSAAEISQNFNALRGRYGL